MRLKKKGVENILVERFHVYRQLGQSRPLGLRQGGGQWRAGLCGLRSGCWLWLGLSIIYSVSLLHTFFFLCRSQALFVSAVPPLCPCSPFQTPQFPFPRAAACTGPWLVMVSKPLNSASGSRLPWPLCVHNSMLCLFIQTPRSSWLAQLIFWAWIPGWSPVYRMVSPELGAQLRYDQL